MQIRREIDYSTRQTEFVLVIEDADIMDAKFTQYDYVLFNECEKSSCISDKLLALETIARRIEEAKNIFDIHKLAKPPEECCVGRIAL